MIVKLTIPGKRKGKTKKNIKSPVVAFIKDGYRNSAGRVSMHAKKSSNLVHVLGKRCASCLDLDSMK